MNPADLTLNTSALTASLVQRNGAGAAGAASMQQAKTQVPRIDLEHIYTQLKGALGDGWADYKMALSAFILGSLNQAELSWVLQPLLSSGPSITTSTDSSKAPASTLHLHNSLLTSLYANIQRDPPSTDVAPWVVANDKPSASSKNAGPSSGSNDQAEERLKHEVMNIHARDRKRIKALKETSRPVNDGFREIQEYASELTVKPPSQTPASSQNEPQSAGGINASTPAASATTGATAGSGLAKTNFDLEIRRRYAQPLASETVEFPTLSDMQNRIEPICYEEGLVGGVQQGMLQPCAELVEQAAEVFVKEMLSSLISHVRSNLAGAGTVLGIRTNVFRRQIQREAQDVDRGLLQRSGAGLLPCEMETRAALEPLDMQDLRFSMSLTDHYLWQDHFLAEKVMLNQTLLVDSSRKVNGDASGLGAHPTVNGDGSHAADGDDADAMAVDDPDYITFKGIAVSDHDGIMGALDDCLMAAG